MVASFINGASWEIKEPLRSLRFASLDSGFAGRSLKNGARGYSSEREAFNI
jgi:hypothetical protein